MALETSTEQTEGRGLSINGKNEIQQLINDFVQAFKAADVEKIMSFYAPDVVAFDMIPPLQYKSRDAYRKAWEMFGTMVAPNSMTYDLRDLKIVADNEVAFSHFLSHSSGTDKKGQNFDMWNRTTVCYQKINGKWLIVHEQSSVPMDMASGKALVNLKPEEPLH